VVGGLTDGDYYYFDMHAINNLGWGPPSNLIGPVSPSHADAPMPQPSALLAVPAGIRQVNLSWEATSAYAQYSVEIGLNPNGPFTEVAKTSATSFPMKGLQSGAYLGLGRLCQHDPR
jgi:hypothetical protein